MKKISPLKKSTGFFVATNKINAKTDVYENKDFNEAVTNAAKAIELDTTNADAYIIRGIAYGRMGDYN